MSLGSRLSSLLRSAVRSPAVRRAARDLGKAAVDAATDAQKGSKSGSGSKSDSGSKSGSGAKGANRGEKGSGATRKPSAVSHGGGAAEGAAGALPDRASTPPVAISYAPRDDDEADPGEIAWAWVPFEEDITQGKDRPVLVLAREDDALIALMLTSRDRGEAVHVDEHGATWVDIGSGSWDAKGRASEVRADRLLRIRPGSVRREGSKLDEARFGQVARVVREVHGWS